MPGKGGEKKHDFSVRQSAQCIFKGQPEVSGGQLGMNSLRKVMIIETRQNGIIDEMVKGKSMPKYVFLDQSVGNDS